MVEYTYLNKSGGVFCMKKVGFTRHLLIFVLAFAMVINMVPIYGIQKVSAEGSAPVTVEWTPAVGIARTGQTVSVKLNAALPADMAVSEAKKIQIDLSKHEAYMLTDFLNEDGSLKEKITAATGQEISLSEKEDGQGYTLGFILDGDYPELSATFAVSAAGDNRTREYSLNVAAEDVTAVSGQTGEKAEIDYAGSALTFETAFGWTADISSGEEKIVIKNGAFPDHTANIAVAPIDDGQRLYTQSQKINITFDLSEGGVLA